MKEKYIITIGYHKYAVDSLSAATAAINLFAKLMPVRWVTEADSSEDWYYTPDPDKRESEIAIKRGRFFDPAAQSSRPRKSIGLPAPKRGSILCICEMSWVSPRQTCPHCGRAFSESHNRTHKPTAKHHLE